MELRKAIEAAINCASAENGSNTPDYILAQYLIDCLTAFDSATKERDRWYGNAPRVAAVLTGEATPAPRLENLSDDQLNLLFKSEVTDWGVYDGAHFCTNTNDVLPWLEKSGHFPLIMRPWCDGMQERRYEVLFHGIEQRSYAPTLARALVLALIRAKRAGWTQR